MNEAICVLQDGVATAEKIDMIFKKCYGHTMGPLETADLIGLDTVDTFARHPVQSFRTRNIGAARCSGSWCMPDIWEGKPERDSTLTRARSGTSRVRHRRLLHGGVLPIGQDDWIVSMPAAEELRVRAAVRASS